MSHVFNAITDLGWEPDPPHTRCPGPQLPDGRTGCGRLLAPRAYLCDRCQAELDSYAQAELDRERANDAAQDAEYAAQAAYWAEQAAAHPDRVEPCHFCGSRQPCRWDGYHYSCADARACQSRCLDAVEQDAAPVELTEDLPF